MSVLVHLICFFFSLKMITCIGFQIFRKGITIPYSFHDNNFLQTAKNPGYPEVSHPSIWITAAESSQHLFLSHSFHPQASQDCRQATDFFLGQQAPDSKD